MTTMQRDNLLLTYRRSTLKIIPLVAVPFLLSCDIQKPKETPNVIYILMDDLGYGELGCYGQTKIETPNIDKLREDGMKLTQHYSGSPVSGPSRCVLLTGKPSGQSYIRGNKRLAEKEGQLPIPDTTYTVAELMKEAGYATACIGKWGLGYPGSEGDPNNQGFDYFYGYNCQTAAHTYYPAELWENDKRVKLNNENTLKFKGRLAKDVDAKDESNYLKYGGGDYSPDLMHKKAMKFIDNNKKNPFFLFLSTPLPHVALQAPKEWVDYYQKKFGDEEPYIGDKGYFPCRSPRATYAAMVSYFDEQVGEIVEKLKADGIYDNTLIIFTSDNGPSFNGGTSSPWFNSGGLFRSEAGRAKCSLYEGGIRVPFIAVWKDQIAAGTTAKHISGFHDFLPTLAEITSTQIPEGDGISYLSTLLGKDKAQKEHPYIYFEYPEGKGWRSIREGDWKLIAKAVKSKNPIFELYNLADDLAESKNLAEQHPKKIEELKTLMKGALIEAEHPGFRMQTFN